MTNLDSIKSRDITLPTKVRLVKAMIFPLKFFIKETVIDFIFLCSKITADGDCGHEAKRCLLLGKKRYDKSRQCIKTQRHYFADKGPQSEGDVFSSGHVWM